MISRLLLSFGVACCWAAPLSTVFAAEAPLSIDLSATVWNGDLDVLIKHRAIRVLVPYSKTLFFVDYGGTERGMSYDFMHAFEDALNKQLNRGNLRVHAVFIPVSRDKLLPMLVAGEGDVVAANLTVTPDRQQLVDFIDPVATGVREIIVTGPMAPTLRTLDDLAGREVYVARGSSYSESLTALNERLRARKLPVIRLRDAPGNFETEDTLEMVNAGLVKIVPADEYLAKFWQEVYPNIVLHQDLVLRDSAEIAFAIRKNSPQLKSALNEFTHSHRVGTLFGNVALQKYLQQTRWAKNAMSEEELTKFNTLVGLFRKYGQIYQVDWLLMAAQGYQESQLDQSRHSQAGAVGVMQLTPATGKAMDVGDIHELESNIHAGVKYIRFMVDTYYQDPNIDALNKVLFAFASYNAGPNRIRSLRKEAAQRHLDPNVWFDNVERLASEKIGRETVQYVSNIYKYYIAYSLVQDDVERNLNQVEHKVH